MGEGGGDAVAPDLVLSRNHGRLRRYGLVWELGSVGRAGAVPVVVDFTRIRGVRSRKEASRIW